MRLRTGLLLIFCVCGLFGCVSSGSGTLDIGQVVGQKIVFPAMRCRWQGRDTIENREKIAATIVAYYDAKGCTPCKLKELARWRTILADLDSTVGHGAVRCELIFQTGPRFRSLEVDLRPYNWPYPIYFDTHNDFELENPQLPADPIFHTFLLDRENRVVLVGSPVGNPKMWELYRKTIDRLVSSETSEAADGKTE